MNKKYWLFIFLLSGIVYEAQSQQVPFYNHYFANPFVLNPAYAGAKTYTEVTLINRQQWIDLPDAPVSQTLTLHGPLTNRRLGIGFSVYNHLNHIIGRTGAVISASYRIKLGDEHSLSFGLSAGFFQNRLFFDKVRAKDPFEESLLRNIDSRLALDGNFGIRYRIKKFEAGFTTHQLIGNNIDYENETDEKDLVYTLIRHYTATAGYTFTLKPDKIYLNPLLMVKSAQGLPMQIEGNLALRYQDKCWLNLAYKHDAGLGAAIGYVIDNKITLSYAYEAGTQELKNAHNNSHEVMIGYRFGTMGNGGEAKEKSGNTVTLPKEEVESLRRQIQEHHESMDVLEQQKATLEKSIAKKELPSSKQPTDTLASSTGNDDAKANTDKKTLKNLEEQLKIREELIASLKKELEKKQKIEEGATKSNANKNVLHLESSGQLPTGYYAVVGAFYTLAQAKEFQQKFKAEQNLQVMVTENKINNRFYFLYTKYANTLKEAQKEVSSIQKMDIDESLMLGNAWVHTSN